MFQLHKTALNNHEKIKLNKKESYLPIICYCYNHENDYAKYYCKMCDVPCCSECAIEYHNGHNTAKQEERVWMSTILLRNSFYVIKKKNYIKYKL